MLFPHAAHPEADSRTPWSHTNESAHWAGSNRAGYNRAPKRNSLLKTSFVPAGSVTACYCTAGYRSQRQHGHTTFSPKACQPHLRPLCVQRRSHTVQPVMCLAAWSNSTSIHILGLPQTAMGLAVAPLPGSARAVVLTWGVLKWRHGQRLERASASTHTQCVLHLCPHPGTHKPGNCHHDQQQ